MGVQTIKVQGYSKNYGSAVQTIEMQPKSVVKKLLYTIRL